MWTGRASRCGGCYLIVFKTSGGNRARFPQRQPNVMASSNVPGTGWPFSGIGVGPVGERCCPSTTPFRYSLAAVTQAGSGLMKTPKVGTTGQKSLNQSCCAMRLIRRPALPSAGNRLPTDGRAEPRIKTDHFKPRRATGSNHCDSSFSSGEASAPDVGRRRRCERSEQPVFRLWLKRRIGDFGEIIRQILYMTALQVRYANKVLAQMKLMPCCPSDHSV